MKMMIFLQNIGESRYRSSAGNSTPKYLCPPDQEAGETGSMVEDINHLHLQPAMSEPRTLKISAEGEETLIGVRDAPGCIMLTLTLTFTSSR